MALWEAWVGISLQTTPRCQELDHFLTVLSSQCPGIQLDLRLTRPDHDRPHRGNLRRQVDSTRGLEVHDYGQLTLLSIVGCFFGCVATAMFGEKYGRRKTIAIGCSIMVVGAIIQAASYGRAQMIVGRIVSGVGMGIVNSTVPVLQAEFSPKASRGICKLKLSH